MTAWLFKSILCLALVFCIKLNAYACPYSPVDFYPTPSEQLSQAEYIVLAELIKQQRIGDSITYEFDIIETLKGQPKQSLSITDQNTPFKEQIPADLKVDHSHFDFWVKHLDRTRYATDCTIHPFFQQGDRYILIKQANGTKTFRAYERYEPSSRWYQFIQRFLDAPNTAYLVITYEEFLASFKTIGLFQCSTASSDDVSNNKFIKSLQGDASQQAPFLTTFANGQKCPKSGRLFAQFETPRGETILAPLRDNYFDFSGLFDFELIFENKLPLIQLESRATPKQSLKRSGLGSLSASAVV